MWPELIETSAIAIAPGRAATSPYAASSSAVEQTQSPS